MIAVDTSALMAVILDEPKAASCIAALANAGEVLISAGTLAEALIVSARRNVREEMSRVIEDFGLKVVTVTPVTARRVSLAYDRWGKGVHPAGLNFGDCFGYEVAATHGCPLLYVGNDFAKTDIESVV